MIVAGVDEAGRGSVLGPLVVAGVSIEERKIPKLMEMGVKDSKLLSPIKRRLLYKEIKKISSVVVQEKIAPGVIDKIVFSGEKLYRLNYLEAKYMARVLHRLEKFDLAYIDCCDTNQTRFGNTVADCLYELGYVSRKRKTTFPFKLGEQNPIRSKIKSEHHADRNHLVVSAASIIAKVTRDQAILRLHTKYGKFGSGYPSDPETLAYLRSFIAKSEKFPSFTRLSWATIMRLSPQPPIPRLA